MIVPFAPTSRSSVVGCPHVLSLLLFLSTTTVEGLIDAGTHILVDVNETDLDQLVQLVQESGRIVRIFKRGQPVADLTPLNCNRRLPPEDARLKVAFSDAYDPVAPLDEEDWPGNLR